MEGQCKPHAVDAHGGSTLTVWKRRCVRSYEIRCFLDLTLRNPNPIKSGFHRYMQAVSCNVPRHRRIFGGPYFPLLLNISVTK